MILDKAPQWQGQSTRVWIDNRLISQIIQWICFISHSAPFRTDMYIFLFWMLHCGIWNRRTVDLWIWSIVMFRTHLRAMGYLLWIKVTALNLHRVICIYFLKSSPCIYHFDNSIGDTSWLKLVYEISWYFPAVKVLVKIGMKIWYMDRMVANCCTIWYWINYTERAVEYILDFHLFTSDVYV